MNVEVKKRKIDSYLHIINNRLAICTVLNH